MAYTMLPQHNDVFCGWAVAAVAVLGDEFRLRCFTVSTFYEKDAVAYAVGEIRKDYPDWEIATATRAIYSLRAIEEPS